MVTVVLLSWGTGSRPVGVGREPGRVDRCAVWCSCCRAAVRVALCPGGAGQSWPGQAEQSSHSVSQPELPPPSVSVKVPLPSGYGQL
ncbi:hypothetical protein GCM10010400_61060 [Streptomyces aculeolatus]